ncbi:unnamed protein product [Spirodela intermedia]|uniref:phosphoserine transaminase n=1 Tax=Spirodela intermedia TaxID=51605 RepID=A0A7I8IYC6_SPIIN|nr:unnamed protein product [Spirodela intermedia]CAA6662809.1 unnamed protein product [Spirodela intermedia]
MAATAGSSSPGSLLLLRKVGGHGSWVPAAAGFDGGRSRRAAGFAVSCTAVKPSSPVSPLAAAAHSPSDRVFNFAAGPATLPEKVIRKAQEELVDYRGSGMSIMEMSHRGKEFDGVIKKAESDLRELLGIPSDYSDSADFIVTGSWGDKAYKEAQKYCKANLIWSGKPEKYTKIPSFDQIQQTAGARYLHICANETIHGVEFKDYPIPAGAGAGEVLVADMSSNFCSKPVDVSRFGLIYAGAQKNVGPSGVTIVIARSDLLGKAQPITPVMLDLKIHADSASLYNTPPCLAIYVCGLVFEDLLEQGGLKEVEKKNAHKAGILYDAIDGSGGFYVCPVEESVRSLMNVPFTLERSDLEKKFIEEAAKEGMVQLKGHRSVGGVRASIYNAMPLAGVQKLVAFMKDFQARHP